MTTPMRKLGRSIQVGEMSICQIIIILVVLATDASSIRGKYLVLTLHV
jgi:hypothetical protein